MLHDLLHQHQVGVPHGPALRDACGVRDRADDVAAQRLQTAREQRGLDLTGHARAQKVAHPSND